jgi:hypothetical protein
VWECAFERRLRADAPLRRLYHQLVVSEPMDLRRDAYFGGRVEPFRFYYRCGPGEEIIFDDVVSVLLRV